MYTGVLLVVAMSRATVERERTGEEVFDAAACRAHVKTRSSDLAMTV